jgi:hypothetical protein
MEHHVKSFLVDFNRLLEQNVVGHLQEVFSFFKDYHEEDLVVGYLSLRGSEPRESGEGKITLYSEFFVVFFLDLFDALELEACFLESSLDSGYFGIWLVFVKDDSILVRVGLGLLLVCFGVH